MTAFTLAISHKEGKTAILDLVRERVPPLSPEAVCQEFAGVLKQYKISSVVGDRYSGEFVRELFRKAGVNYEPCERSKSEIYGDAVAIINSGAVDLLDNSKLTAQLVGLERRVRVGGKDMIDHGPGAHDDLANAAMGAVVLCEKAAPANFRRKIEYQNLGIV